MKNLLLILPLLLFAFSPQAHAENCTDRDYRGLNIDTKTPPVMGEMICQFKLLLKRRTNQDSLKQLVDLNSDLLGMDSKDLAWDKPLAGVLNELINGSLEDNQLNKLAQASQNFFLKQNRYILEADELKLLETLSIIELQHGGR